MSELFQRNNSTLSRHIKNVFEEGELNPDATVAFFCNSSNRGEKKGRTGYRLYDKFKERTKNELTPVEIHFLESFEKEQKKLKGNNNKE